MHAICGITVEEFLRHHLRMNVKIFRQVQFDKFKMAANAYTKTINFIIDKFTIFEV